MKLEQLIVHDNTARDENVSLLGSTTPHILPCILLTNLQNKENKNQIYQNPDVFFIIIHLVYLLIPNKSPNET